MTVVAVTAGVITGCRQETLDAGDQLDGRAQLEAQRGRQVGLRQPGQAGAVYQVIRENLTKTKGGLEVRRLGGRLRTLA